MKRLAAVLGVLALLVIVVILAAIGCGGEGQAPTPELTTYVNSDFGYSFDYPSNWILEASDSEKVFVWTPQEFATTAMVFIHVSDVSMTIPLERCVEEWPTSVHTKPKELNIISSKPKENGWDWFLEYLIVENNGDKKYIETYFERIDSHLYLIETLRVSATKLPELKSIVDSFNIESENGNEEPESIIYRNSEFGYQIEYPLDWELNETRASQVIISTQWKDIFGFVTIYVSDFYADINVIVDSFPLYLADVTTDEWKDFKVMSSYGPSDRWHWVLHFTYTDITGSKPVEGLGVVYFIQTQDRHTFIVQCDGERSQFESCKKIADSFESSMPCDPCYPEVCIHPYPPALDCGEIPYKNFTVTCDPHRFDGDHDGIGCEK